MVSGSDTHDPRLTAPFLGISSEPRGISNSWRRLAGHSVRYRVNGTPEYLQKCKCCNFNIFGFNPTPRHSAGIMMSPGWPIRYRVSGKAKGCMKRGNSETWLGHGDGNGNDLHSKPGNENCSLMLNLQTDHITAR
jgi:hypothetical protein